MNSDTRNIIIVAYFFPPLGMAGTHRPLAWANYLAAGHRVTVLTVKPIAYPVYDASQLRQLDSRVKVVRAGSTDPARVAKFLPFLASERVRDTARQSRARQLFFPDSRIGFVRPAWRKLKKLLAADNDSILITTSPPVSSHLLGLRAKAATGCKWLSDWRDIWGSVPPGGDNEFKSRADSITAEILSAADLLTATSPKTIEYWRRLNQSAQYLFLPNGYDESDFRKPRPQVTDTVGIYGTINHLTGIEEIFSWLRAFRDKHPERRLVIRHTGQAQVAGLDSLLSKYELNDCWRSDGYLPHEDGVERIRASRVNVISLAAEYDTSYAIPSRLFELLRAEPPLLASFPRASAARQLLEQHDFAGVTLVDNVDGFTEALAEALSGAANERRAGVEVFERGQQLRELDARLSAL